MPDTLTILLIIGVSLAALALGMTLMNLPIYRRDNDPELDASAVPTVFVCIPARNEQANIGQCVRDALASDYPRIRVLVYDDQSTDETPGILARLMDEDDRLSTVATVPLPEGWVGKMHACHQLGQAASRLASGAGIDGNAFILFIDADVRLERDAIARAVRAAVARRAELISTFPRQELGTVAEALVVPMIHFILFSYLPMALMRARNDAGCCAGCGQFLLVRTGAYLRIGGHESFRDSMHDGIKMPRRIRATGGRTDLFDATRSVSCRMYDSWRSTWRGFTKNAYEGLGSPVLLVMFTAMHALGHLLPWGYLLIAPLAGAAAPVPMALAGSAVVLSIAQRLILAHAFRHPLWIALVHPLGVALMTIIQWHSFALSLMNRRSWRGRTFVPAASTT